MEAENSITLTITYTSANLFIPLRLHSVVLSRFVIKLLRQCSPAVANKSDLNTAGRPCEVRIHFELTHNARTCKIRAASDLQHDVRYERTFYPVTPLGGARSPQGVQLFSRQVETYDHIIFAFSQSRWIYLVKWWTGEARENCCWQWLPGPLPAAVWQRTQTLLWGEHCSVAHQSFQVIQPWNHANILYVGCDQVSPDLWNYAIHTTKTFYSLLTLCKWGLVICPFGYAHQWTFPVN